MFNKIMKVINAISQIFLTITAFVSLLTAYIIFAPDNLPKPEEKNIGTLSIVNQIDTVLQTRLMNTQFAKSGIRLQESIQGGVEVYVGLQKFSTITSNRIFSKAI